MQGGKTQHARGSVLVQVALLLMVLMMFLALAVDVGALYAARRHMQNAADAGALAGARAICFGGDPVAQATNYAVTRNGADSATVEILDDNKAHVTANITTTLHFASIIGIPEVNVSADATAMCGVANGACGLWPIAMDITVWFRNCGQTFYVWEDEKILDCATYDCDLDDDGTNDIVAGGDRGWLDFSNVVDPHYRDLCQEKYGSGCGARELACYISGSLATKISLPACISGASGVKASDWQAADQPGRRVNIPLYSSIGVCVPTAGQNCPGGLTYYITDFGCATIANPAIDTVTLPKRGDPTSTTKSKAIIMRIECTNCSTPCAGTGGENPDPTDLKAVSLVD